ncbi:hypothetical protein KC19_8G062200 [Ceratodon purpureus]|uniref:Protein kinase domain-containing protein n=1 Tax=Ceratodon purpureus TaxID=3225 RepID=A0A8T0GZ52_CERPU|nr:hypothetical protein KC19_8G062200 [Ceratodon purpureus]
MLHHGASASDDYSLWKMALEGTSQASVPVTDEENSNEDEHRDLGVDSSLRLGRRRSNWPTQSQLRVAVLKLNRDLEELHTPVLVRRDPPGEEGVSPKVDESNRLMNSPGPLGFYHRGVAERMLRDYLRDLLALNARQLANDPEEKRQIRITNVQKRVEKYRLALAKMEEANAKEPNGTLSWEERNILKTMLEDYTRGLEDFLEDPDEHGGRDKLEAELDEVRANIDMVDEGIPLDFSETRFDIMIESLTASLEGVEGQVEEFSRLHSCGSIKVFNLLCGYVVDTLSLAIHDRLRRYKETLELAMKLEVEDYLVSARQPIFKSVAFCIESLTELARQFQSVVELLTTCSKDDWWIAALELSNALPHFSIPRWSRFSLAIRACEWSMDIVDLAFHALRQISSNGVSTLLDVAFKWSEEKSRMVLLIDGKPLYEKDERIEVRPPGIPPVVTYLQDTCKALEAQDVSALVTKLVELSARPKKIFSSADANMHAIADFLSQKLDGPIPEVNSLPWTFRINPSTLTYVQYIASGASGMVAKFKWLGREVGVKTVKSPGLSRRRFEEEAAILATVQHPNVVRMIGCAFQDNSETGSLVMELMEHDLRTVIEMRCPNPEPGLSPFPLIVAIDIMLQIGEGMQYLREHKILHRDLKAKNILLNRARRVRRTLSGAYRKFPDLASLLHTEEYYVAKLADFGIAKARRQQTNFLTMMAGTTSWRAPEVYNVPDLETANNYQWPADVYSFAMVCYEILTGRIPFDEVPNTKIYKGIMAGDRPSLKEYSMPLVLRDLIERCWATDPDSRPSFAEICKTLWQCKVENILPVFKLHISSPRQGSM